jgi:rSAM/selenodomain-associated transferase 2
MISIIIPTLNEERSLPSLLEAIRNQGVDHEVIVVDGGSQDLTLEVARQYKVQTAEAPPGRGAAVSAGARKARGDVLFFLHADSTLPPGALGRICDTLTADARIIGGNFRLVFDGDAYFSRLLTRLYALIRRIGVYYGDSGIFVRRSIYDALGGFRPIPLMEDLDFVRRLERFGRTCCISNPALITSSRRFSERRPREVLFGWTKLHVLFWLGARPERLAEIYNMDAPRRKRGATCAPASVTPPRPPASIMTGERCPSPPIGSVTKEPANNSGDKQCHHRA